MKTDTIVHVSGEPQNVHVCDNCEEETDGVPFLYWEERDFTLCHVCVVKLYREIMN